MTYDDQVKEDTVMTVKEFANKYHTSLPNVYYWMKKHGIGKKKNKHWVLTPEDQKNLADMVGNSDTPKTVLSQSVRKRSALSDYILQVKLGVDKHLAQFIRALTEEEITNSVLDWFSKVGKFDKEIEKRFVHEKIMLLIASLIGANGIEAIRVKDGYPIYRYIDFEGKDGTTIVYAIEDSVYYIENPSKILASNEYSFVDKDLALKL